MVKFKTEKIETKKCSMCYGYGFYPIGDLSPIGPSDAREWGKLVIKCPSCDAGYKKDGVKYETLLKIKKEMENG
jgi:Zn-finger protein